MIEIIYTKQLEIIKLILLKFGTHSHHFPEQDLSGTTVVQNSNMQGHPQACLAV